MTLCMRQHVQTVDPSDNEEDNENQLNEKVPAKHDKKYKLKYEKSGELLSYFSLTEKCFRYIAR